MTVRELREMYVVCQFCAGSGVQGAGQYKCRGCKGFGRTSYLYRIAQDYATKGDYDSFRDGFNAALDALEKES